jgi:predicted porin
MKKIVLLGVLCSAMAAAHAENVTVYGKMRIFQESYKAGTAGSISQQTNDLSRIGFKGSEDLGGGLKANFVIETGIGADSPSTTTLGDRTSTVGLSSNLGSVNLGRDKHAVARVLDNYDAAGNGFGSSAGTIHTNQGSRLSNGVFVSATPIKGVTATYQRSSSETAGVPSAQAGSIEAAFGDLTVIAARYDNNQTSASNTYGAKYNLSATGTTVFAMYSNDTVLGVESTGKSVGVQQSLGGPLTAAVSYGEKETVKAYNAALIYALSKRTNLQARYAKENATLAANDVRRIGVGIEHNF